MAETKKRVCIRYTAEQAQELLFASLDEDSSSEEELTSDDDEEEEEVVEVITDSSEYAESSDGADFQVDTPAISKVEKKSTPVLGARRCRTRGGVRGTSSIYGTNSQGRISYANQVLEKGNIHNDRAEEISPGKSNEIVETEVEVSKLTNVYKCPKIKFFSKFNKFIFPQL